MTSPRSSLPVLITGCSTGIGRATALHLVRDGRVVWATARNVDSLAELSDAGCTVRALDVTDEGSASAVVREIEDAHGSVGGLVNNAGYGEYGPVEALTIDQWRRQFETNLFGAVRLSQLVLPGMRRAGWGRIVNVSSMGGRATLPGGGAYHASKYALEAMSDALRFEVRGFGIRVSLVEPGPVSSDFVTEATTPPVADGPYARFAAAVAGVNARAYGSSRGTNSSEDIAKVIGRALAARSPRPRYLVGSTARLLVTAHTVLPTRLWDAFLRTQFPTP